MRFPHGFAGYTGDARRADMQRLNIYRIPLQESVAHASRSFNNRARYPSRNHHVKSGCVGGFDRRVPSGQDRWATAIGPTATPVCAGVRRLYRRAALVVCSSAVTAPANVCPIRSVSAKEPPLNSPVAGSMIAGRTSPQHPLVNIACAPGYICSKTRWTTPGNRRKSGKYLWPAP